MPFPDLVETDRLVLRRPGERDRGAWLGIWGDPAVWAALRPGLGPDPRHALARFEHHLDHWRSHGFGLWLAEERATRTIAGWCGPAHPLFVPELADEVEIGWTFRRPFWGRGLAAEGATAAIGAAFEHLPLDRVIALVDTNNHRSQRLAVRLGMRQFTTVEHPEARVPVEVYELTRDAAGEPPAERGGAPGRSDLP
jgi:RimJ/RimL family protein N-acetyltransferase